MGCLERPRGVRFAPARTRAVRDSSAARREAVPPPGLYNQTAPRSPDRGAVAFLWAFAVYVCGSPNEHLTPKPTPYRRFLAPGGGRGLVEDCPGLPALQCKAERRRPPRGRAERSERPRGRFACTQLEKKGPPYCFHPSCHENARACHDLTKRQLAGNLDLPMPTLTSGGR